MAERRGSTISWAGCRVSCRWQAVSNQLCGDSHAFGCISGHAVFIRRYQRGPDWGFGMYSRTRKDPSNMRLLSRLHPILQL
jgi:hypothetical protein